MVSQLKIGSLVRIGGFNGMTATSDTPSVVYAAVDSKSGCLQLEAKVAGSASVTVVSQGLFNLVFRVEVVPS